MKKLSLLFVLLTSAALVLSACSSEPEPTEMVTTTPQTGVLIAEGRLQPVNFMGQAFSLPGQVAEVLVNDGDSVKEGQVLARLAATPDLQLALKRAELEALAAQQSLDNYETAAQVNLTQAQLAVVNAQEELDAARQAQADEPSSLHQAQLDAAEALLQQAEDELSKLETGAGVDPDLRASAEARLASAEAALSSAIAAIDALDLKATMSGKVVDLGLTTGEWVNAGQPVITLADFSSWVVKTDNLTEIEVVQVAVGQKVTLVLDALPDLSLNGSVTHINTRYEEKRGDITYTVTIGLDQSDPALRWGMTASVQFVP